MTDFNAEFYSCCGHGVVISGYTLEDTNGHHGHSVYCKLCGKDFIVPGDRKAARDAIPGHFLSIHHLKGTLEDPDVSQM